MTLFNIVVLPRTLYTCTQLSFRPALPCHFSPLATVRSLGLFSTVGEGCISLVAEIEPRPLHPAEATALVGPLPREKRSF